MTILRFDSVGGASGDMILAALIDLGVDCAALERALSSLPVEPFRLEAASLVAGGFKGTRLRVHVEQEAHVHRHLSDIRRILADCALPAKAVSLALAVFERLAEAEANVHGTTPDKVHFHEVGAVDSIVDIVGACYALTELGIDGVEVGPLPVGCGTTQGAHGTMPVPVPATAALLRDHPVIQSDEQAELVTPTGAALLTTWKARLPAERVTAAPDRIGIALGHRALKTRANLLRAMLLKAGGREHAETDTCVVMECNLDDTVPELLGALMNELLQGGALDVFMTPVLMKKQRPGTVLTVLCEQNRCDVLRDMVFHGTTTFGIREYTVSRHALARRHETVHTPHGDIRVKVGTWRGRDVTHSPEHDDCVRVAGERGIPVRQVYEDALGATLSAREGKDT